MVREVGVNVAPPPILRRINAHHLVALGRHGGVVHLHVMPAAQRGDRLAQIDRDLLSTSGPQLPHIGRGEAGRSERGGGCRADAERRRQHRVGAAGDLDCARPFFGPAGDWQNRAQCVVGHSRQLPKLRQVLASAHTDRR